MQQIILTIPAYEPAPCLPELVKGVLPHVKGCLIVDDGSCRADGVFDELRGLAGVTVLRHSQNRGKGAALKTAFAEIIRRFPTALGTVTADADGQHMPADILRVAESLAAHPEQLSLGVRDFGTGVPFRSRLGNLWTIAEFRLLTGRTVRDTQTGLRGIPLSLLPRLLEIPGNRYDYEIRMLVQAAVHFGDIVQLPISTVYDEGNRTSHFRPFVDTLKTQGALFAAALTARCGWRSRA